LLSPFSAGRPAAAAAAVVQAAAVGQGTVQGEKTGA